MLDEEGRTPANAGDLPDDDRLEGPLRWAPGAMDGVLGTGADAEAKRTAKEIGAALVLLAESAERPRLARLYHLLLSTRALTVADEAFGNIRVRTNRLTRLAEIARLLVRQAPDREPVKLGLALLGLVGDLDTDAPVLLTIGAHDEFTLYAVVALLNLKADERTLWELAKRVRGWGRIQVVERLFGTKDPEIQAWMLRDGFRNDVMDEYLAWGCATTAGLADEIEGSEIDDALFDGATDILAALARGGPAQDLGDYADADRALSDWMSHVERRPLSLAVVSALDDVAGSEALARDIATRVDRVRQSPEAIAAIKKGLHRDDERDFAIAHMAARARGIDAKERLFERTAAGDAYASFALFQDH